MWPSVLVLFDQSVSDITDEAKEEQQHSRTGALHTTNNRSKGQSSPETQVQQSLGFHFRLCARHRCFVSQTVTGLAGGPQVIYTFRGKISNLLLTTFKALHRHELHS